MNWKFWKSKKAEKPTDTTNVVPFKSGTYWVQYTSGLVETFKFPASLILASHEAKTEYMFNRHNLDRKKLTTEAVPCSVTGNR